MAPPMFVVLSILETALYPNALAPVPEDEFPYPKALDLPPVVVLYDPTAPAFVPVTSLVLPIATV